jgi:hypothetical protein
MPTATVDISGISNIDGAINIGLRIDWIVGVIGNVKGFIFENRPVAGKVRIRITCIDPINETKTQGKYPESDQIFLHADHYLYTFLPSWGFVIPPVLIFSLAQRITLKV